MSEEGSQKPEEQPKIVVDDDWKAQAEAEKDRLAAEEKAKPAEPAPAAGAAGEAEGDRELPPATFLTLVNGLLSQTLFALGALQDPRTNRRFRDLGVAKHHIDTLGMLEEKTAGNLSDDEKKALDNALYEVRMAYVEAAQGGGA